MFNFPCDFCELTNHCQLEAYYNIFYNWKIKNLINFLSRCLSDNNIDDIQMNYEYRNITSLIKVIYNIFMIFYKIYANVYIYMYTHMSSSDVNI